MSSIAHGLTRRQLLQAAGAGALGTLLAGGLAAEVSGSAPARRARAAGVPGWRSRPDLRIPTIAVDRHEAGTSPEPIFLAPYNSPTGQAGAVIVRNDGEAVWENPIDGRETTNFQVQSYRGSPVLTWWEGTIELGHGVGEYKIMDASYQTVQTVHAGRGLRGDLHEFVLTPQGSALLTSYIVTRSDLRAVKGAANGSIQDAVFQEVDLASGRTLMEWRSLDHVALTESYSPVGKDWDFFHINSVDHDLDGNLLVSGRSTHTIYKIDRASGQIIWRLGGKDSDFEMGPGTTFAWQHHARRRPDGLLSVFDNGDSPAVEKRYRALLLELDEERMTVRLAHQYTHPGILSPSQGSVQPLANGNIFVGWGQEPYVSEFDSAGRLLFDARLGVEYQSYRAFRLPWDGTPTDAPALAIQRRGNTVQAYASWNGATDVAAWRLSAAGPDGRVQRQLASVPARGFETAMSVYTDAQAFLVEALDSRQNPLGRSALAA